MPDSIPPPRSLILVAGLFEASLAAVAIVLGWLFGYPPYQQAVWSASALGLGVLASLVPLLAACAIVVVPWRPFREMLRVADEMVGPLFREASILDLALVAILAGFGEEMLFRGVLQTALAGWLGGAAGPWIALGLTSILFGLLHLITPTYAVIAGLIGLYLGWLQLAGGNLVLPIAAHAAYDFLALVYVVRVRLPRAAAPPPQDMP